MNEIADIHRKLNNNDESVRRRNLLIHGIPNTIKCDPKTITSSLLNFLEISSVDILGTYRMRIRNSNVNLAQPIILECHSEMIKQKNIDAFKVKKAQLNRSLTISDIGVPLHVQHDTKKPVFATDHLTLFNQEIYRKAKSLKNKNFKCIWTQHGKVLCRKDDQSEIIKLNTFDVVDQLLNNN